MVCATLHQTFNSWCGLDASYCFLSFFTLKLSFFTQLYQLVAWLPQEAISVDVRDLGLSFWKTYVPNQITMRPHRVSKCLEISFSVAVWDGTKCVQSLLGIQIWNEKGVWRSCGMCAGGSAVGVRRQRVLYRTGSLFTGRKRWQLHRLLCAFWQTYVWDGHSENVSETVEGSMSIWTEFWISYFLFPRGHDFKAFFF